eukprot:scaffold47_cov258-Pinguiococcus_pyrenoidosus.AAC.95
MAALVGECLGLGTPRPAAQRPRQQSSRQLASLRIRIGRRRIRLLSVGEPNRQDERTLASRTTSASRP